jgi:hypothetical protein
LEVAFPQPGAGQLEDLPRLRPADEVAKGHLHGPGERLHARHPHGLLKELLVDHEIRTFHV